MESFDIQIEGTQTSVINGPIRKLTNKDYDTSKINFYKLMRQYLNCQPTYNQFWNAKFPNHFFCVDLMPFSKIYGEVKHIPTLHIKLEWTDHAPPNTYLHAFGFSVGGVTQEPNDAYHYVIREPPPPKIIVSYEIYVPIL